VTVPEYQKFCFRAVWHDYSYCGLVRIMMDSGKCERQDLELSIEDGITTDEYGYGRCINLMPDKHAPQYTPSRWHHLCPPTPTTTRHKCPASLISQSTYQSFRMDSSVVPPEMSHRVSLPPLILKTRSARSNFTHISRGR